LDSLRNFSTNNQVLVKNLKNDTVKKIILRIATNVIFHAGNGKLLCGGKDGVVMFDLQQKIVLGDMETSFIRYVVWSSDMESVALFSKNSIVIADEKLVPQCKAHEKNEKLNSQQTQHVGSLWFASSSSLPLIYPMGPRWYNRIQNLLINVLDPTT
jgi:hypothetical protein